MLLLLHRSALLCWGVEQLFGSILSHQRGYTDCISSSKTKWTHKQKQTIKWKVVASSKMQTGTQGTWTDWNSRARSNYKWPPGKFRMLYTCSSSPLRWWFLEFTKTVRHAVTACSPASLYCIFPKVRPKSEKRTTAPISLSLSLQSSHGAREERGIIFFMMLAITTVMISWG